MPICCPVAGRSARFAGFVPRPMRIETFQPIARYVTRPDRRGAGPFPAERGQPGDDPGLPAARVDLGDRAAGAEALVPALRARTARTVAPFACLGNKQVAPWREGQLPRVGQTGGDRRRCARWEPEPPPCWFPPRERRSGAQEGQADHRGRRHGCQACTSTTSLAHGGPSQRSVTGGPTILHTDLTYRGYAPNGGNRTFIGRPRLTASTVGRTRSRKQCRCDESALRAAHVRASTRGRPAMGSTAGSWPTTSRRRCIGWSPGGRIRLQLAQPAAAVDARRAVNDALGDTRDHPADPETDDGTGPWRSSCRARHPSAGGLIGDLAECRAWPGAAPAPEKARRL